MLKIQGCWREICAVESQPRRFRREQRCCLDWLEAIWGTQECPSHVLRSQQWWERVPCATVSWKYDTCFYFIGRQETRDRLESQCWNQKPRRTFRVGQNIFYSTKWPKGTRGGRLWFKTNTFECQVDREQTCDELILITNLPGSRPNQETSLLVKDYLGYLR